MLKYDTFRLTVKYGITPCTPESLQKKLYFFSASVRTSGQHVNFENKKIEKSNFYNNEKVTKIDDIDVNKILISKEEPYGTKNSFNCFIGYNDNDVI